MEFWSILNVVRDKKYDKQNNLFFLFLIELKEILERNELSHNLAGLEGLVASDAATAPPNTENGRFLKMIC